MGIVNDLLNKLYADYDSCVSRHGAWFAPKQVRMSLEAMLQFKSDPAILNLISLSNSQEPNKIIVYVYGEISVVVDTSLKEGWEIDYEKNIVG